MRSGWWKKNVLKVAVVVTIVTKVRVALML